MKLVMILMDYYLPGFKAGGPIQSVHNMRRILGTEFEFRVITRDRDLGDLHAYPGIRSGEWTQTPSGPVLYLAPGVRSLLRIARELAKSKPDLVYLNSFLSREFSMMPVILRFLGILPPKTPLLVAPRGEFSPGALAIKQFRKRFYLVVANALGLYRNCLWHASTEIESRDINREIRPESTLVTFLARPFRSNDNKVFTAKPVAFVARDLSSKPKPRLQLRPKMSGAARFVFVSRIDPMKNLAGAIRLLGSVSGMVELHVYGPCANERYMAECKAAESVLPANVHVTWHGAVPHHEVDDCLRRHHFFLLPTLGENHGHVIFEALMAGCPVIVSDRTPWRQLQQAGVGWDLPLNDASFVPVLQKCVDMSEDDYQVLSQRAVFYATERARTNTAVDDTREMLSTAMGLRPGR